MMLRRVVPVEGSALDVEHPDARRTLLDWYAPHSPEHVRLSFVTTLDGRAAGTDGTSESLTSRTDRMILGVIREHADVVLVGAATVRREGLRRPRRAALAIVSASGDLRGHRLDADDRTAPVIVLTTEAAAARAADAVPDATVIPLATGPDGRLPITTIVDVLRSRGLAGIAAEGGPALAGQLRAAGLVDELCLTVMPRLGGPMIPLLGDGDAEVSRLTAVQLLVDDEGAQYGRWRLEP
ncbi:dihydrofolate reductase family protein [Microcella humidisoli]|uniref:Dihydrofolate reductase family protein n=1 Tax=Microcella humidisoli TaxID=2963406 RepID=A0ABY5FWT4_9MICO|nr:dihydrofolate reductase family protein [Microcella humidisoli]UTT62402.1 dihydrofolate reductase family protein [Microcella humidisoli]